MNALQISALIVLPIFALEAWYLCRKAGWRWTLGSFAITALGFLGFLGFLAFVASFDSACAC